MSTSMSRREMLIELGLPMHVAKEYGDDVPVYVKLFSSTHRGGHPVLIQRIENSPLLPGTNHQAIALVAHDGNREVRPCEVAVAS